MSFTESVVVETAKETLYRRALGITGDSVVAKLLSNKLNMSKPFKGATLKMRLMKMRRLMETDIQNVDDLSFDNVVKLFLTSEIRNGLSGYYKHSAMFIVSEANRVNTDLIKMLPNLYEDTLVYWVNAGDEKVCDICVSLTANGPYKSSKYPEYPHPFCRCNPKVRTGLKEKYSKEGIEILGSLYEVEKINDRKERLDAFFKIRMAEFRPFTKADKYVKTEIDKVIRNINRE